MCFTLYSSLNSVRFNYCFITLGLWLLLLRRVQMSDHLVETREVCLGSCVRLGGQTAWCSSLLARPLPGIRLVGVIVTGVVPIQLGL